MANGVKVQYKVLVFDDETSKAERLRDALNALGVQLDVTAPTGAETEKLFNALYQRREDIGASKPPDMAPTLLDEADVLIVDFDLRDLKDHLGFATGEEIAYSARLFSSAKIIVVLNHPNTGLNNFDLTLQRDREFRADLYVGYEQCLNPGLWTATPGHQGFLPWSWLPLTEDIGTFDTCVCQVKANSATNVLTYFGLDAPDTRPSPDLLAYLGLKRDEDVSFGQLLAKPSVNYVRQKDLSPLLADPDRCARVTAALLRKWLRRWVVPVQTLLADLPHLATVVPWGLVDYKDRQLWDRLADCGRALQRCNVADLVQTPVAQQAFAHSEWVGRPTFFLARARAALEAAGTLLSAFKASGLPKIAFAEDLSRFVDLAQAVEYSVTLDGEAQVRSVSAAGKVQVAGKNYGLDKVVYTPESLIL
jgi:hypothetical protein